MLSLLLSQLTDALNGAGNRVWRRQAALKVDFTRV
jgi:hypothetical protein